MVAVPGRSAVRNHSTRYGVLTVLVGLAMLLALRVWASPIARRITGRGANGVFEFLLIPVVFLVVVVGVLLFLWEPDRER